MDPVILRALEYKTWRDRTGWHNDEALYDSLVSAYRHVSHAAEEEWLRSKTEYSQTR